MRSNRGEFDSEGSRYSFIRLPHQNMLQHYHLTICES